MARPHLALIELAADRPLPPIDDLDELLRSAFEHRMHGLLWSCVQQGELAGPADWETKLAMLSLRDEARHRRLWETLSNVTADLASIGVEVATLKGVAAEARWYDRLGERPCYDVDILVDPGSLARADEVVARLVPDHPFLGTVAERIRGGLLQFLELHVDGMRVDLHFDPLKMRIPCRQADTVWSRTVLVEGPTGVQARAFGPEMSLLYFLLHLNRDRFRYLLGFADVGHMLQSEPLDWDFFDHFVKTEGIDVAVYSSLEVICSTLGIENPGPHPGPGWRLSLWRFLWRRHIRLQGHGSLSRYRKRGRYLLPLLARHRSREAIRRFSKRFADIGPLREHGVRRRRAPNCR